MKSKKTLWVASTALSVVVMSLCLLSGCGEKEAVESPSSSENYLQDPAFMNTLKTQYKTREKMLSKRCAIDEQLRAEKAKDPNSPKAKELQAALDAADADFEKQRQKINALVAERLKGQKNKNAK